MFFYSFYEGLSLIARAYAFARAVRLDSRLKSQLRSSGLKDACRLSSGLQPISGADSLLRLGIKSKVWLRQKLGE